jgi:cold-inducible RNA-binding protein
MAAERFRGSPRLRILTSPIDKPAILLPHSTAACSGIDFQEGVPDLPVRRIELAIRQQCTRWTLKNIFVGNLNFNTSEDELRQIFEPYGPVDRVSIMTDRDTGRSRGFGFVEMTNNEDGDKAITALNGSQIGGRTLNVNEARPKAEHSGGGGGGGGFRDRGGRGGDRGGRGGERSDRGGHGGGRGRW